MFIKRIVCLAVSVFAASCSLAADDRPADANRAGTVSRLRVDQRTIRTLVRQLASNSETEWLEAKHKLLATGRLSVDVLLKAVETDEQPLAERARAVLSALSRSHIQLKDALDRPVEHVLVEFFELVPYSRQLKDQPFAHGFTDVWGGLHLPPSPSKQVGIALQTRLAEHGATTVARLSANDLRQMHSERRPRQFRYLWLPVLPPGSEHINRAVSGVVQDESGRPIAGAEVHADSVFSPTKVYFKGIDPQSSVLTDGNGRFRFYLPHRFYPKHNARGPWDITPKFRFDPVISSDILPADSEYNLTVRVPSDFTLCAVQLRRDLASREPIELRRSELVRRFEFESLAGPLITSEAELSTIALRHQPANAKGSVVLIDDEWIKVDQRIVMYGGPVHPGRYWASYEAGTGQTVSWDVVEVDENSPDVIRLPSPPPVIFRGRVLDGVTGKPLAGVFAGGTQARRGGVSLADVTDDEWEAAEQLSSNPPIDAEALQPMQRAHTFGRIVRTDSEGRYELTQQPDSRFYSVMAMARHKLGTSVRVYHGERFSEVPDLLLFPAATVRLRNRQASSDVFVGWSCLPEEQPAWLATLQDYRKELHHQGTALYRRSGDGLHLRPKTSRAMLVPANLRIRLRGGTSHWPSRYVPRHPLLPGTRHTVYYIDDESYLLQPGDNVDLGEVSLVPAESIRVQVIDPDGQPVAGVEVAYVNLRGRVGSRIWSFGVMTNAQGIAVLYIPPDAKRLKLGASGGDLFSINYFTEESTAEWSETPPQEPFRIQLSNEQVQIVREE